MTLRPLGPSVTFTALARISTPRSMRSRASPPNFTSLAAMKWLLSLLDFKIGSMGASGGCLSGGLSFDHTHDVGFLHNQVFDTVDLDFVARPLAEQDRLADLHVDGNELAALVAAARTDRDNLALHGLLLSGVGDDNAALGLGIFFNATHHYAVMQWTKLHGCLLGIEQR